MRRAVLPLWLMVAVSILHWVCSAPVQDGGAIDKRRESTKETIELEETLKRLAGEDKKYFSNSLAMPMPQVDGLQDVEESSGEDVADVEEAASPPAEVHPLEEQINPLEDQLKELPELEEDTSPRYPIPGPFGPGLQSASGGVEYEPSIPVEDEEEEEDDGEDYYLERIMDTLRRHPELLEEIMQEEANEESDENDVANELPQQAEEVEDYEDRMEQIQAELDSIRAQEQQVVNRENNQEYRGDRESHIVSKKRMVIPNEYVKDDMQTLNKYFDKYSGEGSQEDVPVM